MKKKLLSASVLLSITACLANAASDNNKCGILNINITNLTNSACTLVNSNIKHGYYKYTSSVPTFIPAGSTASPIFLEQSLVGPELELTYSCGDDKLVTFSSKQNLCFMAAGDVYGRVLLARNTSVNYQATRGSWFLSQHGAISWQMQ